MSQINETAIRTPGVYTTEIPTLLPSIAQVSTAIPAFIGYTQKNVTENGDLLLNVPTKIFSLKEYEDIFGSAENETGITVTITKRVDRSVSPEKVISISGQSTISEPSKHNMYYSLRLYFENGGGPCYIVSVGLTIIPSSPPGSPPENPIPTAVNDVDLQTGLEALLAYDEPTIIVFPEGQSIPEGGPGFEGSAYYSLIAQAIEQCRILQDRFTLVDVYSTTETRTTDAINNFRSQFTKNDYLNYAAAYYPNLKTTFDYFYLPSQKLSKNV